MLRSRIVNGFLTLPIRRIMVEPGKDIGTACRVLDAMFLELGSPQLTHELLVTLMAEVTGIINSCPSDIDQLYPLTPNTLLTLKTRPLIPPPGIFTQEDVDSHHHWRKSQYLADQFWTRWKREYLQFQQKRSKWSQQQPNLRKGDIVIMKDQSTRNQWALCLESLPRLCKDESQKNEDRHFKRWREEGLL